MTPWLLSHETGERTDTGKDLRTVLKRPQEVIHYLYLTSNQLAPTTTTNPSLTVSCDFALNNL